MSTPHDSSVALDLCAFIDASPTPFHAVATAVGRLEAAGFTAIGLADTFPQGAGKWFIECDGSLIAWSSAAEEPRPFRIVGAHTDSPNLRLKPIPDLTSAGFCQVGVEVYGGVLLNSWLDRDLGVAGRVGILDDTGGVRLERVRMESPVLRIPQLAIHLDREQNDGLRLDRQRDLAPIWALADGDDEARAFMELVAAEVGVDLDRIAAWDLMLFDLQPSRLIGLDESMVSAPRIDNLLSCHAAISALANVEPCPDHVDVVCLFDHEEVETNNATK